MDELEPVPEDMSVYVRWAYERITRDVTTLQAERIAIAAALEQMQADLERDLY